MSGKRTPKSLYVLKLTVREITPPVWRRVQLPGNSTLRMLHRTIQQCMDWLDYHLHEFEKDGVRYGVPIEDEGPEWGPEQVRAEGYARVQRVLPGVGNRMVYTYDFGDNWEVDIEVERILPGDQGPAYPVCLDGKRAGPPEDSGGPYGYAELVEALRDRKHPRHQELKEWVGLWKPEGFSVEETNQALEVLQRPGAYERQALADWRC